MCCYLFAANRTLSETRNNSVDNHMDRGGINSSAKYYNIVGRVEKILKM
jgi:hypothetical protein